jgi:hypothetical protein
MNIGEEVVCINPTQGLVENKVYIILNADTCQCGMCLVDVGLGVGIGIAYCGDCGETKGCYQEWYRADRFAPLSHLDFVLDEVHELLNPEIFQPCR